MDAGFATSGQQRWPYEAARRSAIDALVADALGEDGMRRQLTVGERLSCSQVVALALGDQVGAPAVPGMEPTL